MGKFFKENHKLDNCMSLKNLVSFHQDHRNSDVEVQAVKHSPTFTNCMAEIIELSPNLSDLLRVHRRYICDASNAGLYKAYRKAFLCSVTTFQYICDGLVKKDYKSVLGNV